jgi:hypothetical protein
MEKVIILGIALLNLFLKLDYVKTDNNKTDKPAIKKITFVIMEYDPS